MSCFRISTVFAAQPKTKNSPIEGLPERLVTEPSREAPEGAWEPLSTRIGGSDAGGEAPLPNDDALDVFFPKPFNDDQLEIIRRLSQADGLVVQGPPGTGKPTRLRI